jgi:ribosome-associated translation inhibitor RaiA
LTSQQLSFQNTASRAIGIGTAAHLSNPHLSKNCGISPLVGEFSAVREVVEMSKGAPAPREFLLASELLGDWDMRLPLQITYRNMESSPAIDTAIRRHARRLDAVYPRIMSCRVLVEAPHRRHRRGQLYRVRIDIKVPGAELVVGRSPDKCEQHQDFYVALRDAFRAARRELTVHSEKRRRAVKRHRQPGRGIVTKILWGEGYGFLRAREGHSVYFHENSVFGGLEQVDVGAIVKFEEELGEHGPQATIVKRVGRRRFPLEDHTALP